MTIVTFQKRMDAFVEAHSDIFYNTADAYSMSTSCAQGVMAVEFTLRFTDMSFEITAKGAKVEPILDKLFRMVKSYIRKNYGPRKKHNEEEED